MDCNESCADCCAKFAVRLPEKRRLNLEKWQPFIETSKLKIREVTPGDHIPSTVQALSGLDLDTFPSPLKDK